MNVTFYIRESKKEAKQKTVTIYCKVNCGKILGKEDSFRFSTGQKVSGKNWTNGGLRPSYRNTEEGTMLQIALDTIKNDLTKVYRMLIVRRETTNIFSSEIKKAYKNVAKDIYTIFGAWEQWVQVVRAGMVKDRTFAIYRNTGDHLKAFIRRNNIRLLADINESFTRDLHQFIIDGGAFGRPSGQERCSKIIGIVSRFLYYCQSKDWMDKNNTDWEGYKIKVPKRRKIFTLSESEVQRLIELDLSNAPESHRQTRDAFIFCCETGLRHSDMLSILPNSSIGYRKLEDRTRVPYLSESYTQKTGIPVSVRLSDVAMEIYSRYGSKLGKNPVLKSKNRIIKDLCKKAGILRTTYSVKHTDDQPEYSLEPAYKLVTFHVSRSHYITKMLNSGVSREKVASMVGCSVGNLDRYYVYEEE